jgi:hypothetical protein
MEPGKQKKHIQNFGGDNCRKAVTCETKADTREHYKHNLTPET